MLQPHEIEHLVERGYLVVKGVIPPALLERHRRELSATLRSHGVEPDNLERTAGRLKAFGSGFGGFLELYHLPAMAEMRALPAVYRVFVELLAATYATSRAADRDAAWPNAYGPFDPRRLYAYINRCAYRVPTRLAARPGVSPLQRGTGPHLDIHPIEHFSGVRAVKDASGRTRYEADGLRFWHPLQGLVAVTSALEPGAGGFCTIPGFHRQCRAYFERVGLHGRNPRRWGNSTHLTTRHDAALLERFEFIPAAAGDLLVWDNRMPHMSEDRNEREHPRQAIYLTYLPDVPNNRVYAAEQRAWYLSGEHPDYVSRRCRALEQRGYTPYPYGPLGRRLLALDPWDEEPAAR